ncbi:MAG: hypothetical protein WDN45_08345 [Caulobacteraceae bacterium]
MEDILGFLAPLVIGGALAALLVRQSLHAPRGPGRLRRQRGALPPGGGSGRCGIWEWGPGAEQGVHVRRHRHDPRLGRRRRGLGPGRAGPDRRRSPRNRTPGPGHRRPRGVSSDVSFQAPARRATWPGSTRGARVMATPPAAASSASSAWRST